MEPDKPTTHWVDPMERYLSPVTLFSAVVVWIAFCWAWVYGVVGGLGFYAAALILGGLVMASPSPPA